LDALSGEAAGGVNTWDNEPSCPRNTAKAAGDTKSLSEYVETYAQDQNLWANDFIAAYEKLLSTGYGPGELNDGPEVLGIGKTTCGQYKVKKEGWNYGCQLASSESSSSTSSGKGSSSSTDTSTDTSSGKGGKGSS